MNYILFIATVLSVSGMCNLRGMLSPQMEKLVFFFFSFACLALAKFSGRKLHDVDYPRLPFFVMLGAIFVSALSATMFHSQSLSVSIISILPAVVAYSLFWAWMKLDIDYDRVLKFLVILGLVGIPVYFINAASFPNFIFGDVNAFGEYNEDFSRGILRLPVYYIEIYCMLVLYCVNKWMLENKKKWIIFGALFTMMVILSVMRKMIFLTAVMSLVMYLRNASWTRRIVASGAVALVILVVLPSIPFYQAMMDLSEEQVLANSKEDDIRITAFNAYVNDYQTNNLTRIIGNGQPSVGNSAWGNQFESLTETSLCYYVDVGWAGFYWLYGAVATVCLIVILIRAIMKKKPVDRQYLTYWFILIVLASFVAGPIVYNYQIVSITIGLYLVFGASSAESSVNDVAAVELPSRLKGVGGLARLRNKKRANELLNKF